MPPAARKNRSTAEKRAWILAAAREIFAEHGLEGASLRAVANHAGYTPAALYFHFDSKEALYAEVLNQSLIQLAAQVEIAVIRAQSDASRFYNAAMAFFTFYRENPRDLDLGFYLFRGGMKPAGLGHDRDIALNTALEAALQPIADAAIALGASKTQAKHCVVDCFAHASGLLLLLHTGRIRLFNTDAEERMAHYLQQQLDRLKASSSNR